MRKGATFHLEDRRWWYNAILVLDLMGKQSRFEAMNTNLRQWKIVGAIQCLHNRNCLGCSWMDSGYRKRNRFKIWTLSAHRQAFGK